MNVNCSACILFALLAFLMGCDKVNEMDIPAITACGEKSDCCNAIDIGYCTVPETNGLKRVATINRSWALKKRNGKFPSARFKGTSYSDYKGNYMIVFTLHANVGAGVEFVDGVIEGQVDVDKNINGCVRHKGSIDDFNVNLPVKATLDVGGSWEGLFTFKCLGEEFEVKMLVDPRLSEDVAKRLDEEWARTHRCEHVSDGVIKKIKTDTGTETIRSVDIKSIEDLKEYFSH